MPVNAPSSFKLVGLPPDFFGETYVFISVWRPAINTWAGEYSILVSRPKEDLLQKVVTFDITDYPTDLPPVDEAYMEGEALRQAKIDLALELERSAFDRKRDDCAFLTIQLERSAFSPVSVWTLQTHPVAFKKMMSNTKSNELQKYLTMVAGIAPLRPA